MYTKGCYQTLYHPEETHLNMLNSCVYCIICALASSVEKMLNNQFAEISAISIVVSKPQLELHFLAADFNEFVPLTRHIRCMKSVIPGLTVLKPFVPTN